MGLGEVKKRRRAWGRQNPSNWGKCVEVGSGWRCLMCSRLHLGTLSNAHCLSLLDLWVYGWEVQHPSAMPVVSKAVRFGAQSGQQAEMPAPQQLLE